MTIINHPTPIQEEPCITRSKSKGALKTKKNKDQKSNIIKMIILAPSMATQKPLTFATKTFGYTKAATMKGATKRSTITSNIKLLTNVEKLRLLTKAEKAGLLSAAEKAGFSLSSIEKLGLLSKAEELGVLSAATDPSTPSALLTLSLALLGLGPLLVFLVPEDYPWEIGLQAVVALVCVVGGSAAFAASNFVSNLQKSS